MSNQSQRKPRVPLGAQLNPDDDADLIAWLEGIPAGQKQVHIKAVLRAGLAAGGVKIETPRQDHGVEELQSEIATLRQYVEVHLPKMVSDDPALSKRLELIEEWVRWFNTKIPDDAPPEIQAQHEADAAHIAEMRANLNNSEW